MDLSTEDFRGINKFIQDWYKDKKLELETTFGVGGIVDSTTFLQIAQRLRNKGFEVIPQDDRLSVLNPSHIRLSLQGLGVLQSYCKDDTLQGKAFTAMFKDRAFPDSNVDLKEYDIRFKIRREEELSNDDPRVVALLTNWERQKKAFRLIRRWSFRGKGIRIDMSMVRQTPSLPGRSEFQWVTSFLQKNILKELPRYEVEVELLHDTEYTDTPEKALKSLIAGVGEVQRAIQKNSLLIRNSIANKVRTEYQKMVGAERFRGVNPVTLEVKNMSEEVDESIPNIRAGFNVTDKADGLRAMGYVNKEGELFLIDMSMKIYRTGLKSKKCAESLVDGEWVTLSKHGNSINHYLIFDVYYYDNKNVSGKPFILFKDEILDKECDCRYNAMRKWYEDWREDVDVIASGVTESNRLIIALKRFEFATAGNTSIFRCCATVLDSTRIYYTDGLILTSNTQPIPDRAGVRWNQQFKWKPAKDNTVDFLINFERDPSMPTVDKITTTIHPSSENTVQFKTMRLYVGSDKEPAFDNPRATILLQQEIPKEKGITGKYKPSLFNPIDFPDTMANTCNVNIETDSETGEEYCSTEDSKEPILDRSVVEMRYDPTREPGWRWVPMRIRHDKTERLQRAVSKPGPTNYSGTMNDEGTALSVWNSIHNPVTETMIRSGAEEPTEEEIRDLIKFREGTAEVGKKYYERKAPQENIALVKGLQDFHNKYIKNEILLKRVLRGGNKHILDLACGKAGDLFKWLFNRARYVVGIDTAGENITNPVDGAYKRYLEAVIEFGLNRVPKMAFVIGNSSKNIVNGEAGANPEERDILRSIFGRSEPEGSVPRYIETVMAGSFRAGADVASCMFALHYFFENADMLAGFLKNLSETVKVGGYFIGCCFDGQKVFNLLRTTDKGHSKSGKENDIPIWTITKDYDKEELTPDEESIGLAVDVEFISIGATHKEYLVPFEFLKKKLSDIGFELLDAKEQAELGLNSSTNTFDVSYGMAERGGKKYSMPQSVKDFSFLNRWFIFKRKGETAVPVMPKITLADTAATADTAAAADADAVDSDAESAVDAVNADDADANAENATKPLETGLPARDKKFSEVEIFRFGTDARQADLIGLKDEKGKKDLNIGRWMSLSAPFPIPDPDDPAVKYPTVEHYLAGMKLKLGSNKPNLAKDLMSSTGRIHQDFVLKRRAESVKPESARDFELLAEEANDVRKKMTKTYLNQYRVSFDDVKWIPIKDKVLMDALQYRWDHDKRFHAGVEAARALGKYLLYSTKIAAVASELGGTRSLTTGIIEGENKVGRFIMELAGFKF